MGPLQTQEPGIDEVYFCFNQVVPGIEFISRCLGTDRVRFADSGKCVACCANALAIQADCLFGRLILPPRDPGSDQDIAEAGTAQIVGFPEFCLFLLTTSR